MNKILVPTDFSERSEYALEVAAQIAKKCDAEIFLFHILEIPLKEIDPAKNSSHIPAALAFMKVAQKKFKKLLAKPYLKGIKINEKVKSDYSLSDIKIICHEYHIDMIVMGSHGARGMKEMFVGSQAEKVVRKAQVPVLVIKSRNAEFKINQMVFASDFKNDNKRTYIKAIEFAQMYDAHLHLVFVNSPSQFTTTVEANKRIKSFTDLGHYNKISSHIFNDSNVELGILNFSKLIEADVIGISTHGRQGIAHFLNGSLGEDVVNHANRPVLTFKI